MKTSLIKGTTRNVIFSIIVRKTSSKIVLSLKQYSFWYIQLYHQPNTSETLYTVFINIFEKTLQTLKQKKPNKWIDLIRYTNHTTHPTTTPQKPISKFRHHLPASSNTPTFTISLQTTWNLNLPNYRRPATRRRSQPPRQTTRKLSLSSQPSSAALMAHPTPVRPLYPSQHDRTV